MLPLWPTPINHGATNVTKQNKQQNAWPQRQSVSKEYRCRIRGGLRTGGVALLRGAVGGGNVNPNALLEKELVELHGSVFGLKENEGGCVQPSVDNHLPQDQEF